MNKNNRKYQKKKQTKFNNHTIFELKYKYVVKIVSKSPNPVLHKVFLVYYTPTSSTIREIGARAAHKSSVI